MMVSALCFWSVVEMLWYRWVSEVILSWVSVGACFLSQA